MIEVILFLFGLVVGSFLNVCIVRLPEGRSVVAPASHCPSCRVPIRWYDNIPLISFLLLRGRCRSCGRSISWRYPAVEAANGLLFVAAFSAFGISGEGILVAALCSSLLVITAIDLDHQIIPDAITLPGMVLGLVLAPFFMTALAEPLPFGLERLIVPGPYLRSFLHSLLGLLAGGGPLFLIGWLWEKLRKVEAMGGGDIKLMGMVGSFTGWKGGLMTIMLGAMAGSIIGVLLILLRKHEAGNTIPFGPFLALGALLTVFFGPELREWYFGMLRP